MMRRLGKRTTFLPETVKTSLVTHSNDDSFILAYETRIINRIFRLRHQPAFVRNLRKAIIH